MVLRREASLVKCVLTGYNRFTVILFLLSLFILFSGSSINIESSDLLEKIGKRYQDIKTIQCDFFQDIYLKDIKRTERAIGRFYFKKPSMARWDYERPKQIILIREDEIIIYDKAEGQILSRRLHEDKLNAPYIFLIRDWKSFTNTFEIFNIRKAADGLYRFSIRRKGDRTDPDVNVWIDPDNLIILRIRFYDLLGNVVNIYFKNIEENKNIDDSFFNPEIIKGKSFPKRGFR